MRPYIIMCAALFFVLSSATQDTEQTPDQLDAAARECGNRAVRNATRAKVRLVSSSREIYFQCGAAWRNAAIASVEELAHEKYANFAKRKDAHLLNRFIRGEMARLLKQEEARLSDIARRIAPGPSGGFDHALQLESGQQQDT